MLLTSGILDLTAVIRFTLALVVELLWFALFKRLPSKSKKKPLINNQ